MCYLPRQRSSYTLTSTHSVLTSERFDALLDSSSTGIVEPDNGSADEDGLIHDLADLLGVGGGETAAEDGEVLTEDESASSVDETVTRDHAVSVVFLLLHPEIRASMLGEHVIFYEAA